MKRLLPIMLFCIFLLKIGALTLVLEVCRETLRRRMMHNISQKKFQSKSVEVLYLDELAYRYVVWEKPNKEFWFKSQLYDVISIQQSGKKITIFCINDTMEKKVASALHFITFKCKNHSPVSQAGKIIIQMLLQPIDANNHETDYYLKFFTNSLKNIKYFSENILLGNAFKIFVPPQN